MERYEEVWMTDGAAVVFTPRMGNTTSALTARGVKTTLVMWGPDNTLPDYREALVRENNIVPQIIRTKRDIILGGGLMAYIERFDGGKRIVEEQPIPVQFQDYLEQNQDLYGGLEEMCDDLLLQGNYFVEMTFTPNGMPVAMKPHRARLTRAERMKEDGIIHRYWVHGNWGRYDEQRLYDGKIEPIPIPGRNPKVKGQTRMMYQGKDTLLGGPYYYDPHFWGSSMWIQVANEIPKFHLSNLTNGFNIRYLIKVPEDYFIRSLGDEARKDPKTVNTHVAAAKQVFKDTINKFLAGAENAGRGLIVTKHFLR